MHTDSHAQIEPSAVIEVPVSRVLCLGIDELASLVRCDRTAYEMTPRIGQFRIQPLMLEIWPAIEDLLGERGPCSRCWCMYWRIGPAYRKRPSAVNKAAFHDLVHNGPPPGLIAFHENLAVGWCQLTPRDDLPWLDKTWRLRRVDDALVWSISCFYIRKGYRRRGVTSALIEAAVDTAKAAGASVLEAYPLDADLTTSTSGTGYASTFQRAGFEIVARHAPPRPIMRLDLRVPRKACLESARIRLKEGS